MDVTFLLVKTQQSHRVVAAIVANGDKPIKPRVKPWVNGDYQPVAESDEQIQGAIVAIKPRVKPWVNDNTRTRR